MRIYREPIEVCRGVVGDTEGPARFLWRDHWWQVRAVESRWTETGPWWDAPAAQAVRTGAVEVDERADLLDEVETWRVVATSGRTGATGVCELTHVWTDGQWRLDRLVD